MTVVSLQVKKLCYVTVAPTICCNCLILGSTLGWPKYSPDYVADSGCKETNKKGKVKYNFLWRQWGSLLALT